MSIETLKEKLPEYAKDLKLNISAVIDSSDALTPQQLWGTLLASAIAARNEDVLRAIHQEAAAQLSEEALRAAKGAAAIMGMNNVYYRFTHLVSNQDYRSMPPKLRMNIMMNHGVDKVDFELWSLAVSSINGCGMCMDGHENQLVKAGVRKETVQQAVRAAAVVKAVADILNAETVLAR